jgi:hypothetical protein
VSEKGGKNLERFQEPVKALLQRSQVGIEGLEPPRIAPLAPKSIDSKRQRISGSI